MAKKSRYTGYAEGVHALRQPIIINTAEELATFLNRCDDRTQINITLQGGDAFAENENSRRPVHHE